MGKLIDLTGKRFGRLTVIERAEDCVYKSGNHTLMWKCKCDCGNTVITRGYLLRGGRTKSCGCLQKERARDSNFKDITGERFGRLIAIKPVGMVKQGETKITLWLCKCDCGNYCTSSIANLKKGSKKSCGCLVGHNNLGKKFTRIKKHNAKSKTRLYKIWIGMKTRCYNPKAGNYKYYGEVGVFVCDEWLGENGFENFKKWAENNGYSEKLTLDRKENDKPYSPENCRWATMKEQARNTRQVKSLEYNGEIKTLPEWAEIVGMTTSGFKTRLKKGWSVEQCIETPPKRTLKTE